MKKLILFILFIPSLLFGAEYYISPSGSDGAAGTSDSVPWKTFAHSFGAMSAGDTLWLMDGTYSLAANTGVINKDDSGQGESAWPPSGNSKTDPTIVRAVNEGEVFINGAGELDNAGLMLGDNSTKISFVKIQGIGFNTGWLYNTTYCYIKSCYFYNSADVESTLSVGVDSTDHDNGNTYNLIEDCFVWTSSSRLLADNYRANYNVWRRVVIRGDGCNTANCNSDPTVGITTYRSHHVSMQNVIIIDRVLGGGDPYADFATAQHISASETNHDNEWLGCMSIASEDSSLYFEADNYASPTVKIENFATYNNVYGLAINDCSGCTIDGATVIGTFGASDVLYDFESDITTNNVIGRTGNTANYAAIHADGDGFNLYAVNDWASAESSGSTITTKITTDQLGTGVKYLTRVEDSGALDGTGYNSGDIGATITHQYGVDGTFYGDEGFNTLQTGDSNKLWPWPNEDMIKTKMATISTRGFCTTGNQLDGITEVTLTSYIWEILGYQMPSDIYGETPTTTGSTAGGSFSFGN